MKNYGKTVRGQAQSCDARMPPHTPPVGHAKKRGCAVENGVGAGQIKQGYGYGARELAQSYDIRMSPYALPVGHAKKRGCDVGRIWYFLN